MIESVTVMPERQAIAELRDEAGGHKKWKARPGKAEPAQQRRVRITWKPFYGGEGDAPTDEDWAVAAELEARD